MVRKLAQGSQPEKKHNYGIALWEILRPLKYCGERGDVGWGQVVRSYKGGASLMRMVLKVTRMRAIHCSWFQDPIKQKNMKKLRLGKSTAGSSGFRRSHLLKLSCVSDSRVLRDDSRKPV